MISTEGLLTVPEVAERLHLSTEQVRRRLREGKLKGQRIGNQWFVDARVLEDAIRPRRLIPKELMDRADALRKQIYRENGTVFDVVADLRRLREEA